MLRQAAIVLAAVLLVAGCTTKNHPPDAPSVPTGPTEVAKDSLASFSSSSADLDGDSVSIRFDWGDGDTSEWSSLVGMGTSVSDTHRWSAIDTYGVRAQARDAHESLTGWSESHGVAVEGSAPVQARSVYRDSDANDVIQYGSGVHFMQQDPERQAQIARKALIQH